MVVELVIVGDVLILLALLCSANGPGASNADRAYGPRNLFAIR
jgi:hypothetical protein